MSTDVVITGLGTVGAWGRGSADLARALAAGTPSTAVLARRPELHRPRGATLAANLASQDFAPLLTAAAARRLSLPSRLAIVAGRLALLDAGLPVDPASNPLAGPDLGLAVGTVFGTAVFTERLLAEILSDPLTASPFLFAESVANAPAAQAAIALLAQGPNITVCQREASGVLAVSQAVSALRMGQAKAMLAGELDEASPLLHAALDRFGALASPRGDLPEAARPFDRRRNGMLMAEGATVLLLETAETAAARGASLRARVAAVGGAFDASATTTDWGHGASALAAGLRRALDRAGCTPEAVDVVVSGAGGSVRGDRLEAALLHAVWQGRALPPVVAPKSVTGDYGGGLLASALLVLAGSPVTRRADFEPDPELDLVPWSGPLPHPPRTVLVTATAAGGAAGWLLLTAP